VDLPLNFAPGPDGGASLALAGLTRLIARTSGREVRVDANGATSLANINVGPFDTVPARALERVRLLDSAPAGPFEARLLGCLTIALMAIWLKPDHR
jgi:hypothetical protein